MKICPDHWAIMRQAIETRGLMGLVAKDGAQAADNMVTELKGGEPPFDPLMSLNMHFWNEGLRCGGLYMMGQDEHGNEICPVCEFVKHAKDFDAQKSIDGIADQIRAYCVEKGWVHVQ